MILVDTSVWVDHFNHGDTELAAALHAGRVLSHPFVIGELALGNLRQRDIILSSLKNLPMAVVADESEVLGFIERHKVHGIGIGYVDVHLLAAAMLSHASVWTRDRRLMAMADRLELSWRTQ